MLINRLSTYAAEFFSRHAMKYTFERPLISFAFDDFPLSALENGGRILERHNTRGTFYTSCGLAGAKQEYGNIAGEQEWIECVQRGHELGCHTHDHSNCSLLQATTIEAGLARNQEKMHALGLPALRHFAYPFGQYSLTAKRTVMRHYRSARTTRWGINRNGADWGLLRAVPIYSRHGGQIWQNYCTELESMPGWLILYTHDVTDNPSRYGCTPQELEAVLKRVQAAGADILTVGAAMERLRAGFS